MADLSDVLDAIAQGISSALYPDGITQPSIVGVACVAFPGWPDPSSLDADLARGTVQISVFPRPGVLRVQGRGLEGWKPAPKVASGLTASASGSDVTFAGAGGIGDIAAVIDGGRSWTVLANGAALDVAQAMAAKIQQDRAVIRSGATLTLPGAVALRARVVAPRPETLAVRRQVQGIQVTIWAPTPVLRASVGRVLDLWTSRTPWLPLPAGETARLTYAGIMDSDEGRQARLHRRDLMVSADYPTTDRRALPATAVGETHIAPLFPPGEPDSAVVLT